VHDAGRVCAVPVGDRMLLVSAGVVIAVIVGRHGYRG
jgi:hypothetical protein